jgi:hypothetical protein
MNNSENRKLRLFAAVISLSITAAAFGSVPLAAQVSTVIQGTWLFRKKDTPLRRLTRLAI